MLDELLGEVVIVDFKTTFVGLGRLHRVDPDVLELLDADFHDLRDTRTSRENYVAESAATGIKRNRKSVLLMRAEIIAISRLADVVDE